MKSLILIVGLLCLVPVFVSAQRTYPEGATVSVDIEVPNGYISTDIDIPWKEGFRATTKSSGCEAEVKNKNGKIQLEVKVLEDLGKSKKRRCLVKIARAQARAILYLLNFNTQ